MSDFRGASGTNYHPRFFVRLKTKTTAFHNAVVSNHLTIQYYI